MSALVMGMNCYYSNLLEGHQTLPIDIDAAIVHLKQNKGHRDLKNLAAAHIETDRWARACDLQSMPLTEFIKNAHATFYDNLPPESLLLVDGSSVVPGELRQQNQNVIVGQHVPPSAESLPAFMARYESF
jgi:Fic family protein